jgi:hypothetical protein
MTFTHEEAKAWADCGMSEADIALIKAAGGMVGLRAAKADDAVKLGYQDMLDSALQRRLIAVRNALRDLGWTGERFKALHLQVDEVNVVLEHQFEQVGAGRNVVSISASLRRIEQSPAERQDLPDTMDVPAAAMAMRIHRAAQQRFGHKVDPAERLDEIKEHLQKAVMLWGAVDDDERAWMDDLAFPDLPFGERLDAMLASAVVMKEELELGQGMAP